MVLFIIISLFTLLIYAILIFSFIEGWSKIKQFQSQTGKTFSTRCSIIIAARNEAGTIELLLSDLMQQDYAGNLCEIIVVDDHSNDNTIECIAQFVQNNRVKLLRLPDDKYGKKDALAYAISCSTGELLITLDADCRVGQSWLSTIVAFYKETAASFIVCPVDYIVQQGFWHKVVNLEFLSLVGSSASAIANGQAFLCNGANIAYQRDLIKRIENPFRSSVSSGDDIFLLHNIKKLDNVSIQFLKSPDAIAYTQSSENIKKFINQRVRWASKTKLYQDKDSLVITCIIGLLNFYLAILFLIGFWKWHFLLLFLSVFGIKVLIDFAFFRQILPFFNKRYLLRNIVVTDFIYSFYVVGIGILSLFYKPLWKGRMINI